MVNTAACRKCPPNLLGPAGSIWTSWDDAFTKHFPEEVLRREFELHLSYATQV